MNLINSTKMKAKYIVILAVSSLFAFSSCGGNSKSDTSSENEQVSSSTPSRELVKGVTPKNKGIYVFDPKGNKTTIAGFGIYGDKVCVGGAGGPQAAILSVGKVDFLKSVRDASSLNWEDASLYVCGGGYIMRVEYHGETTYYRIRLSDAPDGEIAYECEEFVPEKK